MGKKNRNEDLQIQRKIIDLTGKGLKFMRNIAIDFFSLENGEIGQWESLFYPPDIASVSVFPFTKKGKVVLVRMFRFPIREEVFELPGGDVKNGERELQVAAERELLEETGYKAKTIQRLTQTWIAPRGANARVIIFLAQGCEKVKQPELDPVEKKMNLTPVEKSLEEIVKEIKEGKENYDMQVAFALTALKGLDKF